MAGKQKPTAENSPKHKTKWSNPNPKKHLFYMAEPETFWLN